MADGGSNVTFSVIGKAQKNAGNLHNAASIDGAEPDSGTTNNDASWDTIVNADADLSLTKNGPASVTGQGTVTYSLVAHNGGPSDATAVVVTDDVPAGLTYDDTATDAANTGSGASCDQASPGADVICTIGAMADGGSNVTFSVIGKAQKNAGNLHNSASIDGAEADSGTGNNTAVWDTTVNASADLGLTKAGPVSVTAGGTVDYTLVAHNGGPSDATGVAVTDDVPAGFTYDDTATDTTNTGTGASCNQASPGADVICTIGAMNDGGTDVTFHIKGTAQNAAGALHNSATIDGNEPDANNTNDTATSDTTVNASANLSLTKAGPATVSTGGQVDYTLVIHNGGPSDVVGVSLDDTLPTGFAYDDAASDSTCAPGPAGHVICTIGALNNGADKTIHIKGTAGAPGPLHNSATVTATTADPNLVNNTATFDSTVNAAADLSLQMSDDPDPALANSSFVYTITVTNSGPSPATNVTISDPVPAGMQVTGAHTTPGCFLNGGAATCVIANMAPGASVTVTIGGVTPNQATTITNTATVSADQNDPNTANNSDTETTTVTVAATCKGIRATITGTDAAEVITGTSGADVIVALDGNDIIKPGAGNDLVCAGLGDNKVKGDLGNDIVLGSSGRDKFNGGPGNDVLKGLGGNDKLKGAAGHDALAGGAGTDTCSVGPGGTSAKGCEKGPDGKK
jgi:uncharacterized repeat protein (TIGR01451 family)